MTDKNENNLRDEAIFMNRSVKQAYAERMNAIKEKKMTTNEAGKQKEQSMTFTFKGPISWQWIQDKEKPYLSRFVVESERPPTIEAPNATRPAHEIDALIARHKATLDLLAKPATDRPREKKHKCRCSTANLVELLRARANLADGIDVTDLDAGDTLEIGGNQPGAVIWVRKEDRS